MSTISLKKNVIDLSKSAKISLEKNDLSNHKANLILVADVSQSMEDLYLRNYQNGISQMGIFLTRILGLAKNFNDNAEIQYYTFGDSCSNLKTLDINSINESTANNIFREYVGYRGTSFLSFFDKFTNSNFYKTNKKEIVSTNWFIKLLYKLNIIKRKREEIDSKLPLYILFLTDGETPSSEYKKIKEIIKELSNQKIFIQFLSIGRENNFLEELDNLYDNHQLCRDSIGYYNTSSPTFDSDETLYNELLKDYSVWVKSFK